MSVDLYMDHHVHSAITKGLRSRGVPVLTALEDGTTQLDDAGLLTRATQLGRALFTLDEDFLAIAGVWQVTQRKFAGVIYAHQLRISIGQAIEDLELIAKVSAPSDLENQVIWLPI